MVLLVCKVDSNVVSYNKGTLFSQTDPYEELDSLQIKRLSEIYQYGIRAVVESLNAKKK